MSFRDEIIAKLNARLALGRERYGHGVIIDEDPSIYGVPSNNWEHMALEELLDGLVYTSAAIIRLRRVDTDERTILDTSSDDNDEIIEMIKGVLRDLPEPAKIGDKLATLKKLLRHLTKITAEVVAVLR